MMHRVLRRVVILLAAAAVAVAAAPAAGERGVPIARGVWTGDAVLTGMSSERARDAIRRSYLRPVELTSAGKRWLVPSARFGLELDVGGAVRSALAARPGDHVDVPLTLDVERVREYVAGLARRYARTPRDAALVGLDDGLRPLYAPAAPGRRLARDALVRRLLTALETGSREPIALPFVRVEPEITIRDLGPAIVIRRGSNSLTLFDGRRVVRSFRIATGSPSYPTPLGRFDIVDKQYHPWWYPPPSDWARGLKPVPPGPGNPLGTRWMGLSAWGVGIHGTPDAASVGYSASHGCIRMYVPEAEWLFERVRIGTTVFVVPA